MLMCINTDLQNMSFCSLDCCMQQVISTVLPLLTTATVVLEPHSSDKQPLGLVHTTLTGLLCVHMMLM